MRKSRRQIVNRLAEAAGLILVTLDLLMFFAIYRPLVGMTAEAVRSHAGLRQTIRNQQVRFDVMKKYEAAIPAAKKDLEDFTAHRAPDRRQASSTVAHLIHRFADASKVKVSTIGYHFDSEHTGPLERMAIEINVQGSYPDLIKFSHAVETSDSIFLIREFTMVPGENGMLAMRLGADLYLTP